MNTILSLQKLLDAGPLMYPLLLCSVVVLALGIERAWFFSQYRSKASFSSGEKLLLSIASKNFQEREEQLNLWLEALRMALQKRCRVLQLFGALAPLLGLLGTVLGIITMFQEVSQHTGPVTPALLASGMWQAMSTTAIGLIIAIPALAVGQGLLLLSTLKLEGLGLKLSQLNCQLGEAKHDSD